MIDPVISWFKIMQYDDKRAISIADLVETTWLTNFTRTIEITYDQGSQFISHDSRKSLIETEYGMTSKPSTWGNPTSNAILEQIHQVLGNIVWEFNIKETYVDEDYPWLGILSEAAFVIC